MEVRFHFTYFNCITALGPSSFLAEAEECCRLSLIPVRSFNLLRKVVIQKQPPGFSEL